MKQTRLEKNKMEWILLAVLVMLWCVIIGQKEGFHMDELISYEMANAEYTPWILPTRPEGRLERYLEEEVYQDTFSGTLSAFFATAKDVVENRGASKLATFEKEDFQEPVWISREEFQDYITTTGHDRFRPDSVYFNVITDNHPPLHFMALNLVCSLFSGKFSPILGCLINLLCLLGIAKLLCDLGELLYEKRIVGQAAALLYGTSILGLSTLLLTRMYAMLTLFCVWTAKLVLEKYRSGEFRHHNKLLILATCLGFWTQYFYLLYLIPLAILLVVLLWTEDRKKEVLYFVRSMVIAGAIGLAVYPFAIDDVLHSGRGVEALENLGSGAGTLARYGTMLQVLGQELFGDGILAVLALVLLAVLIGYRLWLMKKEGKGIFADAKQSMLSAFHKERLLVLMPALIYFLVVVKAIPYLEDRYIMAIGGFTALFVCGTFYRLAGDRLKDGKGRMAMMLILLCAIVGILQSGPNYLYQGYKNQWDKAKEYRNLDCLCVYEGVRYYENLPEFAEYENTLLLTMEELTNRSADERLEKDEELVVLAKRQIDMVELARVLHQKYGFEWSETVETTSPFQDNFVIFRKTTGTELW